MSLLPGTNLGPYEIVSPLGAGGMGEVYKANDTRLDRTVAIKVLPEHLSKDPAIRERFEREARAVSSLNHPHICTLHDVGEHDGIHFLVMELVEGESLADRLKRGPLPFEQAIDCAAQIADALGKAHRAGIVHRDLKPGNVMLTRMGVKLLDFGLAKANPTRRSLGEGGPDAPTEQKPLTGEGTILGTVQYMAPEQLEGKDVDARADLFALGAVLYEMLTGRKAFEGESQASVISAIMSSDPPPVSELQSMSPPALDRLVKKCLAKDPEDRWHGAHDLVIALQWATDGVPQGSKSPSKSRTAVLGLAALILGGVVAGMLVPRPEDSRTVRSLDIALPSDEALRIDKPSVAVSRDGSLIAYTTTRQLYLRATDSVLATAIPSSENACCPFFSPDDEWLGFFTEFELKKVSVRGGTPVSVAEVKNGMKGTWGSDGTIIYGRGDTSGLFRVSASGGLTDTLTSRVEDELDHGWPELLPGGNAVLFWVRPSGSSGDVAQIVVQSLATGERKVLVERGANPRYASSGHLIYVLDSTLWAAPFDTRRLELTGEPFPVTEGVAMLGRGGSQFDLSDDGTLVYAPGGRAARRMLWVDRNGKTSPAIGVSEAFVFPRASPDGRRIAASLHPIGGSHDVWIYDVDRGTRSRLTTTSHNNTPVWTPDGTRVTFASQVAGTDDIFWKPVDGIAESEPLLIAESTQYPTSWHPDGSVLAYETRDPETGRDIWLLPMGGEPRPWLATPADEYLASFSPDGRFVAYVSDESGQEEVYVRGYPEAGSRTVISTDGGSEPIWSPNGRELFYRSLDGTSILGVEVRSGSKLSVGTAGVVVEWRYYSGNRIAPTFDVSRDAKRFLVIEEEPGATKLHVVLNWFEELKRLDPNAKR
jgi:serine/threonine protein kinase